MQQGATRLFLPGFGARARSYDDGLPVGWESLQPPPPSVTGGSVAALANWVSSEIARRPGPAFLAGHSMGAALAILVAAQNPDAVSGLLLIAPAGLPLSKPIRTSAGDFTRQLVTGTHRVGDALSSAVELLASPAGSVRLIRALRRLDLRRQMAAVREAGMPVTVIGCATDTLTTPEHCISTAALLGGRYHELRLDGGHVWMFGRWSALETVLVRASR
jgi:pimeloyl-ACP methyl ester carboxylesterase